MAMIYRGKDRYQYQPWYIKLYRRLRYQPILEIKFLWWLVKWVCTGMRPLPSVECKDGFKLYFSTRETYDLVRQLYSWTIPVGWTYTIEELFEEIRSKSNE